eukprot:4429966-Amphidinium_carterae.1
MDGYNHTDMARAHTLASIVGGCSQRRGTASQSFRHLQFGLQAGPCSLQSVNVALIGVPATCQKYILLDMEVPADKIRRPQAPGSMSKSGSSAAVLLISCNVRELAMGPRHHFNKKAAELPCDAMEKSHNGA